MYGGCVLSDHAGLLNFTKITYTIKKAKKTFEYLHTYYIQLLKFYNKWYSDRKEERKKQFDKP